jgi:hypothetical protein
MLACILADIEGDPKTLKKKIERRKLLKQPKMSSKDLKERSLDLFSY